MTQAHQEMYECVQPLQGHISFNDYGESDKTPYRNTFSLGKRSDTIPKNVHNENNVENLVWFAVAALTVICAILWGLHDKQYAFNAVTLTQFMFDGTTGSYKLEYAGHTKPLYCLIIALGLLACSLVLGWQSKRHAFIHNWWFSFLTLGFVVGVQFLSVVVHFFMYPDAKNFAETLMLTNTSMIILHVATAIITVVIIALYAYRPVVPLNPVLEETEANFWLCVAEDLNMIVFYAFIFRAFNSQISVHDDTTTFFDVMCVVVIGFLQHIANILMIFHAHIKIDKDVRVDKIKEGIDRNGMSLKISDTTPTIASTDKIIKSIARTRTLLFFMIAVVTVFLYLRIAPTCEEFPAGIPFELLRSLALVCMISLNTLHSISFEMQGSKTDKPWDTSPTWKLLTTGLIACILAGFLMADVDKHKDLDSPSQARHAYLLALT
jgi:hypothetical protein